MQLSEFHFVSGKVCEFVGDQLVSVSPVRTAQRCLEELGLEDVFITDGLALLITHSDVVLPTLSRVAIFALYTLILYVFYSSIPSSTVSS